MSLEQNKILASDFFARFNDNDIAGALDLMSEEANWWIAGKPAELPAAGDHTTAQIARVFYAMKDQLKEGLRISVKSLIAEGDKVALEVESLGELKNGRVYNQQYHVLMTIRDGKINEVREYLDTQHVFAIWFQS